MTDHPITPPPEVVKQWITKYGNSEDPRWQTYEQDIATQAANWGADMELDACCEWLRQFKPQGDVLSAQLLRHRRPKLKSRKQRALDALTQIGDQCLSAELAAEIRNALEELPND